MQIKSRRGALGWTLAGFVALLWAPGAAAEVSVFVSAARPEAHWRRGVGAALSSTWFQVLAFEGELARQPADLTDGAMTSFTASALLAPPIGPLTPYGGLGVGLFRQSLATDSDTGTLRVLVLGLKLQLGLVRLKGEFRSYNLSGNPLLELDNRLSFGVAF